MNTALVVTFAFAMVVSSVALAAEPYDEALRPQFHFTAQKNWLNDPNGLVFYKGTFHLFFQHNPRGLQSGNLTWGHATSPDLVHWQQQANAIEPDALGPIWSGSAAVDWHNTAGLQKGDEKTLVALYAAAGGTSPESKGQPFTQCLAYSTDAGRTWTKYAKNPVLAHIRGENRDPKVIFHQPTHTWIVALYLGGNDFALLSSPDLKSWTHLQDLNIIGCDECPDFFPILLDGDKAKERWIFTAANGKYLVGSFDGKAFKSEQELRQVDFGRNFYAVQTYSDAPDGRRIQIAWMRDGQYPGMPFNQQMSFPAELKLVTTPDGPRLFRTLVREIELLHETPRRWSNVTLSPGDNPLAGVEGDLFHIRAEIELGDAREIGFNIRGEPVVYSVADQTLNSLGTAPLNPENGRITIEILVDRTSIEAFGNGGRVSLTGCFQPKPENRKLELFAKGGAVKIISLDLCSLKSAWKAPAAKSDVR